MSRARSWSSSPPRASGRRRPTRPSRSMRCGASSSPGPPARGCAGRCGADRGAAERALPRADRPRAAAVTHFPDAPAALGRGVIVAPGAAAPERWDGVERVAVGAAELASPVAVAAVLHQRWAAREPVVIELAVDPAEFREPQPVVDPPYALAADLDLPLDRLHHLVWANNYDARSRRRRSGGGGRRRRGSGAVVGGDGRRGASRRPRRLDRRRARAGARPTPRRS